MTFTKIAYERHPVSLERKRELNAQGFKVLDERFAPKPEAEAACVPTREEIADMPRSEVIEWLQAHGVDDPRGKLTDLRAALERVIYL